MSIQECIAIFPRFENSKERSNLLNNFMTETMRFTSLLSPLLSKPCQNQGLNYIAKDKNTFNLVSYREFLSSKCHFRNHSNFSSEFKIRREALSSFGENDLLSFPPLYLFSKAVFFITVTITWIITLQIYTPIMVLTIEELGILKITQKPLDRIWAKKRLSENNSDSHTHYN